MAINPSAIGSRDATTNYDVCIEILGTRPVVGQFIVAKRPPGQLVGFYNTDLGGIELFVVSSQGNSFLKVV